MKAGTGTYAWGVELGGPPQAIPITCGSGGSGLRPSAPPGRRPRPRRWHRRGRRVGRSGRASSSSGLEAARPAVVVALGIAHRRGDSGTADAVGAAGDAAEFGGRRGARQLDSAPCPLPARPVGGRQRNRTAQRAGVGPKFPPEFADLNHHFASASGGARPAPCRRNPPNPKMHMARGIAEGDGCDSAEGWMRARGSR